MIKTEQYLPGKWNVFVTGDNGEHPFKIGHIVGARKTYLAEAGPINLGCYRSKQRAIAAIANHYGIIV